ncbi:MAG: trypsin-like peptidase domain-containing protein [Vallitaleaceae bacterium]|nr:trypsin-like peptidase domain-containing protein [Vallitaleaceae bacterium]
MKLKKFIVYLAIILLVLAVSSCKHKSKEETPPLAIVPQDEIAQYMPSEQAPQKMLSKVDVTNYAWKVYETLAQIEPDGNANESIYTQIEKEYFVDLKASKAASGFFPFLEDMLFGRMHFEPISKLGETIVCEKIVSTTAYYLVQLKVLGYYNYEFSSNDEIQEKSGITTMVLYIMLSTKEDGSLGYYSLLSFTKEPHEMDGEIKMFNGLVDAQDEQFYLKTVSANTDGLKQLSDNEQFAQNNEKVVTVYAQQSDGTIRQSNGCYIHQFLILAPLNIIEGSTHVWVYTAGGDLIKSVGIVDSSEVLDLALIKLEHDLPFDVEPIARGSMNEMAVMDPVYLIGNVKGLNNELVEGVITNFWTYKDVEYCQTTVSMMTEHSGAALLNQNGQLIGIVSNRVPNEVSFIQSIEHIRIFDAYFAMKGKSVPVKTPFATDGSEKTAEQLIKMIGYQMVYSNNNVPSDLSVNKELEKSVYEGVVASINSRAIAMNQGTDLTTFISGEMQEEEKREFLALQELLLNKNEGKAETPNFIQDENINILGISNNNPSTYLIVEMDRSFYDKEQQIDAPIRRVHYLELLKFDITTNTYQLVGTVNGTTIGS